MLLAFQNLVGARAVLIALVLRPVDVQTSAASRMDAELRMVSLRRNLVAPRIPEVIPVRHEAPLLATHSVKRTSRRAFC